MKEEKEILLNDTYQKFMSIGLGLIEPIGLDEIVDEELMGFGSTVDEKIMSLAGLYELLARQKQQSEGVNLEWKIKPVKTYVSKDENTAVFAGDIFASFGSGAETVEMYLRFSVVLVYTNHKWLVFHWHGSKPENVQSEVDTFGIEDLRKRTVMLEELVAERTLQLTKQKEELESALKELKSTQAQLIQSEKMASLGELTAGIAHEIQNPLNFVNNFSEVNNELIEELKSEWSMVNSEGVLELLNHIYLNNEKINHHGKRADAIVKGMLLHSSSKAGSKEPTDINVLADEYLRLSYHGMRAKDAQHSSNNNFNVSLNTDYDNTIGKINIIPQDIARALLNIINNAFYAVAEKSKMGLKDYIPAVVVTTKKTSAGAEIRISDNGNGIPSKILDKIFQPFFTTKPTGQGTGLGLSLAYDIVKAHGGELKVSTREQEGTTFSIQLTAN